MRIELRIDDGDILGMVTLGDEEERVVFADVTHVVDRLASHRRTGESVVHIDYLDQEKRYYKETHGTMRPFPDSRGCVLVPKRRIAQMR